MNGTCTTAHAHAPLHMHNTLKGTCFQNCSVFVVFAQDDGVGGVMEGVSLLTGGNDLIPLSALLL